MEDLMAVLSENKLIVLLLIIFFLLFIFSVFCFSLRLNYLKKMRRKRHRAKRERTETRVRNGVEKRTERSNRTVTSAGMKLEIANISHQGGREYQEDAFAISNIMEEKKGILAVIADGMGGMAGGKEASNTAVTVAIEEYNKLDRITDPVPMLLDIVETVNDRVSSLPELQVNDGGTTFIMCYIKEYDMNFLSVGDSRICLIRDGKMIKLNKEHTLGNSLDEMVMRGEMDYEEAMSNPMRKMLNSFIGAEEIPKIDYSKATIFLKPKDKIILMSDGVFGTLSDEEIIEALDNSDLNIGARLLEHRVLSKKKKHQDNFTAVIIKKN